LVLLVLVWFTRRFKILSKCLRILMSNMVEFKAPLVVAPPTYIVDELKAEGDWEVYKIFWF
jgi:aconitase B